MVSTSTAGSRIRVRLFLWTLLAFTPALLLAAWLIYESQRNQRTLVERSLTETARSVAQVVTRQIGQSESLLRALATSPYLKSGDWEAFYHQADSLALDPDEWIVVNALDGQQTVNTYLPWGAPLGKTVPPLEFAPQLAQGVTHLSNLIPSAVQTRPVLSVVVPVTENGRLTQALSFVMLPSRLSNILSGQFPPDWVASIVDREGTIVARSRRSEEFVGKKATGITARAIAERSTDVFDSVSLDGEERVTAVCPTPQFGWSVVVAAPRTVLYAPARRLVTGAAVIAVVLVLAFLIIATSTARRIAHATERLAIDALRLGHGEQPERRQLGFRELDGVQRALHDSAGKLRQREAELTALNETLEVRVRERTEALAAANSALKSRNQELEDFAHVISHDMQGSVQRIGRFGELLETEFAPQLGETGLFYVQRIRFSTGRMSRLIRDILAFSSVTRDTRPAERVDLNETLSRVTAELDVLLAQTQGRIEVEQLHPAFGDPAQLFHLLLNLVGNGLKFQRQAVPPVVRVTTEMNDERLHLRIEDNGIGIDERHLERIFAPFERLHSEKEYSGSGIGLAIVRRIVDRHGGSIRVRSKLGEGSCFEVVLPPPPKVT